MRGSHLHGCHLNNSQLYRSHHNVSQVSEVTYTKFPIQALDQFPSQPQQYLNKDQTFIGPLSVEYIPSEIVVDRQFRYLLLPPRGTLLNPLWLTLLTKRYWPLDIEILEATSGTLHLHFLLISVATRI